ncbi:MAG: hypothetical protein WAN11_07060, partial [Syntrophobacteraceae bacterium]
HYSPHFCILPFLVAVLHDLSECARLFGKPVDPPQRRKVYSNRRDAGEPSQRSGSPAVNRLCVTAVNVYVGGLTGQMETVSQKIPYFSMTFPGSFHLFPCGERDYRPNFSSAFRGPRRRVENVCHVQLQSFKFPAWLLGGLSIAHFEARPGYDGSKPKIPMMFPGCIHGKEKD